MISAIDLLGSVSPAIGLENLIVEVLDAQAQARHTQVFNNL